MEVELDIFLTILIPEEGDPVTFWIGYWIGTTVLLSIVQKGNYLFPVPGVDLPFLRFKTSNEFPVYILAKI